MGIGELIFCTAIVAFGKYRLGLGIEALRTLALVALVFASEGTLYAVRERRRLWSSRPSLWVVVSSVCDVVIITTLAVRGIAMTALPLSLVAWTLAAAAGLAFVLDLVKAPVFSRLRLS